MSALKLIFFFYCHSSPFCSLYQQQFALQQALFQQQQAAFNSAAFGGPGFGGAGFAGAGAGTGFGGFPVYGANFASAPNYIQNRFPAGNFNGASSSASFGPGGFHQTAAVYPGNPVSFFDWFSLEQALLMFFFCVSQAVPNVDTRFGGSEQATSFQSGKPGMLQLTKNIMARRLSRKKHNSMPTFAVYVAKSVAHFFAENR